MLFKVQGVTLCKALDVFVDSLSFELPVKLEASESSSVVLSADLTAHNAFLTSCKDSEAAIREASALFDLAKAESR